MKYCWEENPSKRPTFSQVNRMLDKTLKSSGTTDENFFDNLIKMLEMYASNLEQVVDEKVKELENEKNRKNELLMTMMPEYAIQSLRAGVEVPTLHFENVTVLFSDIVNFDSICHQLAPFEIVNYLDELYSVFDEVIDYYRVYKVETIADQYVVVSGIPTKIDPVASAEEVASLSLHLMRACQKLKFINKSGTKIKTMLRIGVHNGPVVAGVVGISRPRFCLFGDTMNTASRVLTTGKGDNSLTIVLKINISQFTKALLDVNKMFTISSPMEVEMKGKGTLTTYAIENSARNVIGNASSMQGLNKKFPSNLSLKMDKKLSFSSENLNR
ncbi:Atrial natriuretic peptide receptor 1 [Thelohanellus kitauei]|uniref:Atrial natriuretic peptide receptor 1 n=1 Tax=Thelohanellus kitauei TaxID=669202 RepID=A0A0C2ND09_THEKT|nr:Atrial natriuretic peptide receptor 1 [Thelohanellus kitauei]